MSYHSTHVYEITLNYIWCPPRNTLVLNMYMFYSWNILTFLRIVRVSHVHSPIFPSAGSKSILRNTVQGVPLKSYSRCPIFNTRVPPCTFFERGIYISKVDISTRGDSCFSISKTYNFIRGHPSVNISKMHNFTRRAYVSQSIIWKMLKKKGLCVNSFIMKGRIQLNIHNSNNMNPVRISFPTTVLANQPLNFSFQKNRQLKVDLIY